MELEHPGNSIAKRHANARRFSLERSARPWRREPDHERLILDPRRGDAEDDVSSPKQKSLLAIAGSLLAEISVTKLLLAWIVSIVLPAAILGLAPLIVTAWLGGVFTRVLELYGYTRRASARS